MKTIEEVKTELAEIQTKIEALERKQNGGYTAQVAKSFHLGMVGGSGRNNARLNRRRESELDKTIELASKLCELYPKRDSLLKWVEDEESGLHAEKEASIIDKRKARAEYWKALKVGDELNLGNSNGNPIISKKSAKSLITTGGTKWTAQEIIGREAALLL